jgi:hypothetical protein
VGAGVAYSPDTIPLILDDVFAADNDDNGSSGGAGVAVVARLDLASFLAVVRTHAPCLDFLLVGDAAR